MKTKKFLSVLMVLVIASATCFGQHENANPGGKVDLKFRLKAGESHEMKISQTQNITQAMNGLEQKMTQQFDMLAGLDVLSVDESGVMDVEFVYKSMKVTMDGQMGHIEFDSANPKLQDANNPMTDMMGKIFSCMVGSKFQTKVSPTGETSDMRGFEAILEKFKKSMGDGPEAQAMTQFFDQFFDKDKVKNMAGDMMVVFPADPVGIGDAWYDKLNLDLGFPIDTDTTYMLKKRENGLAYIDSIAKMDMGDSAKPIEMGPAKMTMQMAGVVTSAIAVDETTGLVQTSNTVMNLSGMVKMEANEQMPDGMVIPMTIDGNVKVELIK